MEPEEMLAHLNAIREQLEQDQRECTLDNIPEIDFLAQTDHDVRQALKAVDTAVAAIRRL